MEIPDDQISQNIRAAESELNSALSDLTSKYSAQEFVDDDVQLPPAGSPDPEPRRAERPEGEASVPSPASPAGAAPETHPAVLQGLDKLVEREAAFAQREALIAQRERRQADLEKELVTLRASAPSLDAIRAGLRLKPTEALRELGIDPDTLVPLLTAEKLGDKAPPELRQMLREAQRDREIAELRERDQRREAESSTKQFWDNQAASAMYFVREPGEILKDAPLVSYLREQDPVRVAQEILNEIQQDAKDRLAKGEDPNAPLLPHAEAVRRLQKKYEIWSKYGTPKEPPVGGAAPQAAPSKQEGKAPQSPAPAASRPLKPWQQKDDQDLIEAGIRAGVQAARRVASASKV